MAHHRASDDIARRKAARKAEQERLFKEMQAAIARKDAAEKKKLAEQEKLHAKMTKLIAERDKKKGKK